MSLKLCITVSQMDFKERFVHNSQNTAKIKQYQYKTI